MAPTDHPPSKKDVTRSLLLRGSVYLHLDPRIEGVVIPKSLSKQPQVMLQIGLDMPVPIPDLLVDEAGVTGTLSFGRSPFLCIVPWDAVFAVLGEDGRYMVWPESMPSEVAAEIDREARRNRLRAVTTPEIAGETNDSRGPRERVTAPPPTEKRTSRQQPKPASAAVRQVRADTPTLSPPDAQKRSAPKPAHATTKSATKRPLPPYLRVVK